MSSRLLPVATFATTLLISASAFADVAPGGCSVQLISTTGASLAAGSVALCVSALLVWLRTRGSSEG